MSISLRGGGGGDLKQGWHIGLDMYKIGQVASK